MIVFTDNEGCLTPGKGKAYDLEALVELRELRRAYPTLHLVLCTGRSMPYSEGLLQALDLQDSRVPAICEGGPVLYYPAEDRHEILGEVPDFGRILAAMPSGSCYPELGKLACLTLYPAKGFPGVTELGRQVRQACQALDIRANVTESAAAVDITLPGMDKAHGVRAVAHRMGWDLASCAAFGDAANDLPMLKAVGMPMCPANALPEVKRCCAFAATQPAARGLVEAIHWWAARQNAS